MRIDVSYEHNEIIFTDEYEYQNINGRFQWIFTHIILF